MFKFHTIEESEKYSYYQIPKELFTNKTYKVISTDAKLLYGILRDRVSLSKKNKWYDNNGHVFIIFPREEVMEILDIAKGKCSNLFKELANVDLIKEIRQGLNKPNIIYVGQIIPETISISGKSENQTSESSEIEIQEVGESDAIKTDIIKPDLSETKEVSQSVPEEQKPTDGQTDNLANILEIVDNWSGKDRVSLDEDAEIQQSAQKSALFVKTVVKKLYTNSQMSYVLKMDLTFSDIKERLELLIAKHIDIALHKTHTLCKGTNREVYFAKALLSAIVEAGFDE